jgi:hypothetical protein
LTTTNYTILFVTGTIASGAVHAEIYFLIIYNYS